MLVTVKNNDNSGGHVAKRHKPISIPIVIWGYSGLDCMTQH